MNDEREGKPSCSNFARYAACPGSWLLEKSAPPQEETDWSKDGDAIHEWLECPVTTVTDEQREIGEQCLALGKEACHTIYKWPDLEIFHAKERRFWLRDVDQRKIASGKADVTIVYEESDPNLKHKLRCLVVIDYKTGRLDVDPAPSNEQLRGLVACIDDECGPFDGAHVAIVGPFQHPNVSIAVYTPTDIVNAKIETRKLLMALDDTNAPRVPGEHCRYCPCKAICKEHQAEADKALDILTLPVGEPTKQSISECAQLLTDDSLAGYMDKCELRKWATEAIISETKRRLKLGHKVGNWKLGKPERREKVTNVAGVFSKVQDWCTPEEFSAVCSVTKEALKGLVKSKLGMKGKNLANTIQEIVEGCVTETFTEPSLEREPDTAITEQAA